MAIHEECGVFGVMSSKKENVARVVLKESCLSGFQIKRYINHEKI